MINKPHKKLNIWKKSVTLISKVYEITRSFPHYERFGIISQMRRSALSVASNVAEGAARHTRKEFIHFLYMAQGSLSELDTQFDVALELGYLKEENIIEIAENAIEIDKMLTGLIKAIKKKIN